MGFEMLGSRYLNPYFGSGIHTWAALISTVLAALSAGYFAGGRLADRYPSLTMLGATVAAGSAWLVLLPLAADPLLETIMNGIEDVRWGSLVASLAIMFPPVAFLGMFSPFAVRLLMRSAHRSGAVSGGVYGVSTLGSIAGTLGTTFVLMPLAGSRAVTIAFGVAGIACGGLIALAGRMRRGAAVLLAALPLASGTPALAGDFPVPGISDTASLKALAKRPDGVLAHMETEYNDIFIVKRDSFVTMAFQRQRRGYTESAIDLADPTAMPVGYTSAMTVGLAFPETARRALMIGLGGGSVSTYLAGHMPDLIVETVELDPGVIRAAKQWFGVRETPRTPLIEADGRVFLTRNNTQYDLILLDAFRGGYVPFHLLTAEFYALTARHLAPGGAAVFNLHSGTKLYDSTLVTLKAAFASVDLYDGGGGGNVIAVAMASPRPADSVLAERGAALQRQFRFRYELPALLATRLPWPGGLDAPRLTDDFSPVNLYESIRDKNRRQW
ncbi:MAG: hypothetical protein EXR07_02480 [Acetobacteraceae bacterium]|nr:hypothetical protein [Acetobacteraceae bacterium]